MPLVCLCILSDRLDFPDSQYRVDPVLDTQKMEIWSRPSS